MSDDLSSQLNPPAPTPPAQPVQPREASTPTPDIFAGVEGNVPPPQPTVPASEATPRPLEPLEHLPELEAEDGRRKVFVWIGVVVAIAIVGVGGWFAYAQLLEPAPATDGGNPASPEVTDGGAANPEAPATDDDFDRDGLTNAEEQQLQTDPYSADTDADGLYDREEASAWHTDPLNPDTDADSYLDGAEVANGFNPKGSGPLLELPTSTAP